MERNVKQFVNPERILLKLVTLFFCIGILDKKTELLGKVNCKDVKRVRYSDFAFDDELAKRDGLEDSAEVLTESLAAVQTERVF